VRAPPDDVERFQDLDRMAGLLQAVRRGQARRPSTDNSNAHPLPSLL
jgi:hypothetical protein